MGAPMAKNLIKAGHSLVVYDIIPASVEGLKAAGAATASSPQEVAAQSDIVITMLPNSPHVKEVVLGKAGVLEGARPGLILIDMSSIAPEASKEVYAACRAKGVAMIDAPVSGGEPKAVDGSLSIMVGGDEEVFRQVKGLLLCMGASVVRCGPVGAGNLTKLVNQLIVACNIAACAEGLTLAQKAGVDPAVVVDAIKGGLAGSTVMNAKAPMMLEQQYRPGFKIDLHIKDLENAISAAHGVGAPLALTPAVMEMFQTLRAGGWGQADHSALKKYYDKLAE
jgi:2-hydroxy-3-oxopropionate reductase